MKKVLRIIARLNIGGPAIHTVLLTKWLNKEKFYSLLATGTIADTEGDMTYFAEQNGVFPINITGLSREIRFGGDFFSFFQIFCLLFQTRPDILHTHTAKAGTLGRLACVLYNFINFFRSQNRCSIVHTFHGHVFHSYFSLLKTKIFLGIEKALAVFTDAIIVISERQKRDIVDIYKICPKKKVHVIPLGFDLSIFLNCSRHNQKFRKEFLINNEVAVGIVGRLVPVKNHKFFLDVVSCIGNKCDLVKFFIVGDGELKEELVAYAGKKGIEKKVFFLGWQKDLDYIYDGLDIVCLTSDNEGTPVSLIEAMASQKSIITTDVGGVSDIFLFDNEVKDDQFRVAQNGIVVPKGDLDAYTQGLMKLINDKSLREEMGAQGRCFVSERFGVDRLVGDIESLYRGL